MIVALDITEKEADTKLKNKLIAEQAQVEAIETFTKNQIKEQLGLTVDAIPLASWQAHVQDIQTVIDNPPSVGVYQPPLPPGVPPPDIAAITALITREPGWNNALGYRIVLTLSDPTYVPANIALAIYTAADCVGYRFTTGAFQYDSVNDKYFSVCPAGFEPGDANVHMGLLYGAAQLSCFTLPAGETEKEVLVYSQEV